MKIKMTQENIKVPTKAYKGDAGFDIFSPLNFALQPNRLLQVKLGFAIELSEDEVCIMSERSGMAIKYSIHSIGNIIDASYRGEISIILLNSGVDTISFKIGERIGQMLILKLANQQVDVVDELSISKRAEKAHFSSGL